MEAEEESTRQKPQWDSSRRCHLTVYIFLGSYSLVFIASVVIGSIYVGNCPADDRIPEILLSLGVLSFISLLLILITIYLTELCSGEAESDSDSNLGRDMIVLPVLILIVMTLLAQIGLAITLAVLAGILLPDVNYDPETMTNHYCHPVLFKFSMATAGLILILIILSLLSCAILKIRLNQRLARLNSMASRRNP